MGNIEKVYISQNAYITTYYIYDTLTRKYYGILEDHNRDVTQPYFVAWYFNGKYTPGVYKESKTALFYDEKDAINFIIGG